MSLLETICNLLFRNLSCFGKEIITISSSSQRLHCFEAEIVFLIFQVILAFFVLYIWVAIFALRRLCCFHIFVARWCFVLVVYLLSKTVCYSYAYFSLFPFDLARYIRFLGSCHLVNISSLICSLQVDAVCFCGLQVISVVFFMIFSMFFGAVIAKF